MHRMFGNERYHDVYKMFDPFSNDGVNDDEDDDDESDGFYESEDDDLYDPVEYSADQSYYAEPYTQYDTYQGDY